MAEKLDLKDRKILFELDRNCRQSNAAIGRAVGLSKDVVAYRMKRLEEIGVVEGYRTTIDTSKLGYLTFRVYLKFQDTAMDAESEILKFLCEQKNVWWVGKLSGRYDVVFACWSKSVREFYAFFIDFLGRYRRLIQEERISSIIEYIQFHRNYLLDKGEEDKAEIIGSGNPVPYDELDWKILGALASNARLPLIELAEATGVTAMAIKYRIRQLEVKGVIQGYRALINYSKLGYEYYKVDMWLEEPQRIPELQAFCRAHPNIVYIDRTVGGSDIEFEFEIESLEAFHKMMGELKDRFKGAIRNFDYFAILKIYKVLYFPF